MSFTEKELIKMNEIIERQQDSLDKMMIAISTGCLFILFTNNYESELFFFAVTTLSSISLFIGLFGYKFALYVLEQRISTNGKTNKTLDDFHQYLNTINFIVFIFSSLLNLLFFLRGGS
jgi:hypothetical protein